MEQGWPWSSQVQKLNMLFNFSLTNFIPCICSKDGNHYHVVFIRNIFIRHFFHFGKVFWLVPVDWPCGKMFWLKCDLLKDFWLVEFLLTSAGIGMKDLEIMSNLIDPIYHPYWVPTDISRHWDERSWDHIKHNRPNTSPVLSSSWYQQAL